MTQSGQAPGQPEYLRFDCPYCGKRLRAMPGSGQNNFRCTNCRGRITLQENRLTNELRMPLAANSPPAIAIPKSPNNDVEPKEQVPWRWIVALGVVGVVSISLVVWAVIAVRQQLASGQQAAQPGMDSPIRLKDGKPLLVQKGKPVFPAGTKIKDTPDGMFMFTAYVRFVPENKREWEFEFRPIGRNTLRLFYGDSNGTNNEFLITSDQTGQDLPVDTPFLTEDSYEVFDRQGKSVFQWTTPYLEKKPSAKKPEKPAEVDERPTAVVEFAGKWRGVKLGGEIKAVNLDIGQAGKGKYEGQFGGFEFKGSFEITGASAWQMPFFDNRTWSLTMSKKRGRLFMKADGMVLELVRNTNAGAPSEDSGTSAPAMTDKTADEKKAAADKAAADKAAAERKAAKDLADILNKLEGQWAIADAKSVTNNNMPFNLDSPVPPVVSFHVDKGASSGACTVTGVPDSPGGRAYLDFLALPRTSKFSVESKNEPQAIDFLRPAGQRIRGILAFKDQGKLLLLISTAERPESFETIVKQKNGYQVFVTLQRKSARIAGQNPVANKPVGEKTTDGKAASVNSIELPGSKGPLWENVGQAGMKIIGADVGIEFTDINTAKPPKTRQFPSGAKSLMIRIKFEKKPVDSTIEIPTYNKSGRVEMGGGRGVMLQMENTSTGEFDLQFDLDPKAGKFDDGAYQARVKVNGKVVAVVNWGIGE
jgi:hypothetical protein